MLEMRRFLAISITLSSLAVISSLNGAEEFNSELGAMIVWAGDSITHQCGYTQYLENFLYTRFHDKKLRFANAGIKGDRAGDLLDRFDEDVAKWQPQYVTLL
jgi:lysophospholipase L1-like esterase